MVTAVIVIAAVLILSCFVPFPVFARVQLNGTVRVRLLIAGILPVSFSKEEGEEARKKEKKPKPKKKKPKKKKRRFSASRFFELVLEGGFVGKAAGAIGRFLKRLLFSLKIRVTEGHVTYGSEDPARTALAAGRFYAVKYSLPWIRFSERFTLSPDFRNRGVRGHAKGHVLIYFGKILLAALLLIVEWPVFKTLSLFKKA